MHALAQRGATRVVVAISRLRKKANTEAPLTLGKGLASALDPRGRLWYRVARSMLVACARSARGSCANGGHGRWARSWRRQAPAPTRLVVVTNARRRARHTHTAWANYCMQRMAGRLAGANSKAALAGRR